MSGYKGTAKGTLSLVAWFDAKSFLLYLHSFFSPPPFLPHKLFLSNHPLSILHQDGVSRAFTILFLASRVGPRGSPWMPASSLSAHYWVSGGGESRMGSSPHPHSSQGSYLVWGGRHPGMWHEGYSHVYSEEGSCCHQQVPWLAEQQALVPHPDC